MYSSGYFESNNYCCCCCSQCDRIVCNCKIQTSPEAYLRRDWTTGFAGFCNVSRKGSGINFSIHVYILLWFNDSWFSEYYEAYLFLYINLSHNAIICTAIYVHRQAHQDPYMDYHTKDASPVLCYLDIVYGYCGDLYERFIFLRWQHSSRTFQYIHTCYNHPCFHNSYCCPCRIVLHEEKSTEDGASR